MYTGCARLVQFNDDDILFSVALLMYAGHTALIHSNNVIMLFF